MRRLNNLSIPTIPSRFLTPILKFDLHEKEDPSASTQRDMLTRLNNSSGLAGSATQGSGDGFQRFHQQL